MFVILLLAAAGALNAAPVPQTWADDAVLTKLNSDLDALLETDEAAPVLPTQSRPMVKTNQANAPVLPTKAHPMVKTHQDHAPVLPFEPKTDAEKIQAAKHDKKPPIKNGVVSKEEQAAENGTNRDPFKEMGTYTKAMFKHDQNVRWHLDHPKKKNGVKRPYDDLNDFRNPEDKRKRAQKIAKDIYKIIKKPIAKRVQKEKEKREEYAITRKGKKDAAFLHRILVKSKRRDTKERRKDRKQRARMAKEKKRPKLALKNKFNAMMRKEDEKFANMKVPDSQSVAEVEADGKPRVKASNWRGKMPQMQTPVTTSLDDVREASS